MFSKFVNFVPIDLKSGTLIDWIYTMYLAKKCIDQSNVTYVSMANKYPIIKHRAFLKKINFLFLQKWRYLFEILTRHLRPQITSYKKN